MNWLFHFCFALGLLVGNAVFTPVAHTLGGRLTVGAMAAGIYIVAISVFYVLGIVK